MSVALATPAQLAQLSNFVVLMRSAVSMFAKNMDTMNALVMAWNANISAIVGVPVGTTVIDATGLAGAVPLTDTTVAALVGDLQAILATYYTTAAQQLYTTVCGPGNVS
jgi:hypothetical protein